MTETEVEVEVSAKASDVAALRAAAAAAEAEPEELDGPMDRLFDHLDRIRVDPRTIRRLQLRGTEAHREHLHALASGEAAVAAGTRTTAALLLAAWGDKSAASLLSATFTTQDPEALTLEARQLTHNFDLARPILDGALRSRIAELERAAHLGLSVQALQFRFLDDPLTELPPGSVDRLWQAENDGADFDTRQDASSLLSKLIRRGSDTASHEAAAHRLARAAAKEGPPGEGARHGDVALASRRAGPDAVASLETLAQDSNPAVAAEALVGLARLRGKEVAPLLLQRLAVPKQRERAAEALGLVLAGTRDRDAVARLREAAKALPPTDYMARGACALALLRIGGALAQMTAIDMLGQTSSLVIQRALWLLEGVRFEQVLEWAVEAGILERRPDSSDWRRLRAEAWLLLDDEVDMFWAMLADSRALFAYDVEGSFPPKHDRLLRRCASASRGLFAPGAALQTGTPEGVAHEQPAYRLSFECGGRVYSVACRNYGDVYDSEAVLAAVHRALADLGRPERFVHVPGDGQIAQLLFGRPEAIHRFCERTHTLLKWNRHTWDALAKRLKARVAAGPL